MATMGCSLYLALLASSLAYPCLATDLEWYISPNGSADASCGVSADAPCSSLEPILERSMQFSNDTLTCYLSSGATDGRDSTTLYFMGENHVPPVCLMNWTNVRVVGLGGGAVITSRQFGAERGVFEFISCFNISIENLDFKTSALGRAVLFFEASRDIAVAESSISITADTSIGVQIVNCAGEIVLSGDLFYGNISRRTDMIRVLGLDVTHGCNNCTIPFTDEPYDFPSHTFSLAMTQCTFQDLSVTSDPEDSYASSRRSASGARIQFKDRSSHNRVTITDSTFQRIFNSESNGVLINFDGNEVKDVANNSVIFSNCTFQQNWVRYGGGVSAYFYVRPYSNSLQIENCRFLNNTADSEGGGVFVVLLSSGENNVISISNSTFFQNSAVIGSGVYLLSNPSWFWQRGSFDIDQTLSLVGVEIQDCTFRDNVASVSKGVVDALRIQLTISGVSTFSDNTGSAILLRLSLLTIRGEVTFSRNTATTGGALCILDASKVDLTGVSAGYFTDNRALFQGGAIYADFSSTAHLSTEYNHTLAQMLFGGCFLMFGNERRAISAKNPKRFTFSGNTAASDGQHIHSFSLRGCLASNFIPMEIADNFLSIPSDGTIVQETTADSNPFLSTSTGPSYLFFYGASTACYKTVNDITYLLPNCSHDLLNATFYLHPDMRCGLLSLTNELSFIYNVPGTGLRPTVDKLIVPWAAIETTWQHPPGISRARCPEPDPGNLVLSPAPGEEFDLTIRLGDQLLNYVFETIFLVVENGSYPGVLVQFNGLQYGMGERIYFTPNRPLSRIALVGAPGTTGKIRVVADSQVVGQVVVLLLPFQLARCHKGYYLSPVLSNLTLVDELVTGIFQRTQRIPTDPHMYQPLACHCFSQDDSPVRFSRQVQSLTNQSNECFGGYTVQLSGSLWAGFIPGSKSDRSTSEFPPSVPCPYSDPTSKGMPIQDKLTTAVFDYRRRGNENFEPDDVIPYFGLVDPGGGADVKCFEMNVSEVVTYKSSAVFSIELCSQGYCSGDLSTMWVVANESFPCTQNRMGPLCGQCKPGYAVTLYSTTCRDCTDKPAHYYLSLILTLVIGFALVMVIILFNIGASPTIDSLLFFIQTVYLLLEGRSEYESFKYLAFFNPNFTFDLCITPNLDNLSKVILQYVTPVYILLLMAVILLLTCVKRVSRMLGNHSILQGLWLLFLICYFNIASATYEILYCAKVGPEGMQQYVLIHDASVQCYTGLHLPFAIIAWVLVILFVLPLPVYLWIMNRLPKLKPISDVYSSHYKDRYRWWISVSLARRLLLVTLGVFIQDFVSRHYALLLAIAWILLFTTLMSPYMASRDNRFAIFITWMLLLIAINTEPYIFSNFVLGVTQFLVASTIALGVGLAAFEIALFKMKKKTVGEFYKGSIRPRIRKSRVTLKGFSSSFTGRRGSNQHELEASTVSTFIPKHSMVDATTYREPLLDSQFYSSEETEKLDVTSSVWKRPPAGGVSSTGLFLSGEEEDPVFPRKKFGEESVATTEVSTGRSSDSGLAEVRTSYTNYATS